MVNTVWKGWEEHFLVSYHVFNCSSYLSLQTEGHDLVFEFFLLLQVPQGSLGMYLLYGVLIMKLKAAIPEPI